MENNNKRIAPALFGGLLMIRKMMDKLPPSEKKCAEFILQHPQDTIQYTAKELGDLSATSGAAVMRLCNSLGLKGFPELKIRIAGDLRKNTNVSYMDIESNDSQETVVEKMMNNSVRAIQETTQIINYETLHRAVNAIKNASTLHLFGVGASGIIAQDAQQKFIRIQKQTSAFTDIHMAAMYIANVTEKDVVFGISYSGETREVIKILELAKQKGAVTISLTSYGTSSVSQAADINLFMSASQETTFRSGATSSRLAQLHMIDILFMCVVTDKYEEALHQLHETKAAINFLNDTEN